MALESATYIKDLVEANPAAGDPASQGDDHLRLVKQVLKNTFPNITGPVTATAAQLNTSFPVGFIGLWSGAIATIPSGWALCNGATYARVDGSGNIVAPDLRDRFVVAAGGLYTPSATGGAAYTQHNLAIDGTALSIAQIPTHTHTIIDPGHYHNLTDPGHAHKVVSQTGGGGANGGHDTICTGINSNAFGELDSYSATTGITVQPTSTFITADYTGSGAPHTHTGLTDIQTNIPPYYALAFIMKL